MATDHYAAAEDYLERAAELVDTPRIGVARTLAALAQAHATLAQVKAIRQIDVKVTHTDVLADAMPPDVTDRALAAVHAEQDKLSDSWRDHWLRAGGQ